MIKNLIEKRAKALADLKDLNAKETIDAEQRAKIDTLKKEVADFNTRIADLQFQDEQERQEAKQAFLKNEKKDANLVTEFRSFLSGERGGEKFLLPFEDFNKRATITTTSNSHFKFTDQHAGLSINDSDLVLPSLGVKTWYFESGAIDFPSISQIVGTFGSEDNSVSDQTLTSNKKTLTPTFVSASIEVSKVFLNSSKPENIQNLMDELKYAVDKALEKRTIDTFSTLTAIASGATGVSTTFHNASIQMEAALVGAPSGYIFSSSGTARAKNSKKDSGSGEFVWKDGIVNGYPAKRSTLQTNANHGYLITAGAVAQAYWGEGVTIEMITDATLARKGNVLLIASAMADGSYLDANKIAVVKNVNLLS